MLELCEPGEVYDVCPHAYAWRFNAGPLTSGRTRGAMATDPVLDQAGCPKCGAEMEPIEADVPGLNVEHLRLCPSCYLVTWSDAEGIHMRQGVPVKEGFDLPAEGSNNEPSWAGGEPKKC